MRDFALIASGIRYGVDVRYWALPAGPLSGAVFWQRNGRQWWKADIAASPPCR
jgi:hypothetical protein